MPILGGQETLIQATVARLAGKPDIAGPLVVTSESYRFMPFDQLQPELLAPLAEDFADLLAQPSKDRLFPIFGDEHDVVPAKPEVVLVDWTGWRCS